MLKLFILGCAAFMLSGCAGTPEENAAKRTLAVELAIDRIERFNALGIDPIQLDDKYLLALDTACIMVQILGVEAGIDIEILKTIGAGCEVIRVAAAPAKEAEIIKMETTPVDPGVSG